MEGIWVIKEYRVDGENMTHRVSNDHVQWIELQAENRFRSGSIRIDNEGEWHYNPENEVLRLTSNAGSWGNSMWKASLVDQGLFFRAFKQGEFINTSILFSRRDKLPIAKRYISANEPPFSGLWRVDSLYAQNEIIRNPKRWIRFGKKGQISSGDQSGELFSSHFKYLPNQHKIIISDLNEETPKDWEITFTFQNMVLMEKDPDATMYLSRVQEYARDSE